MMLDFDMLFDQLFHQFQLTKWRQLLSFSFIHLGLVRFTSNHYLHVEDVEPLPN